MLCKYSNRNRLPPKRDITAPAVCTSSGTIKSFAVHNFLAFLDYSCLHVKLPTLFCEICLNSPDRTQFRDFLSQPSQKKKNSVNLGTNSHIIWSGQRISPKHVGSLTCKWLCISYITSFPKPSDHVSVLSVCMYCVSAPRLGSLKSSWICTEHIKGLCTKETVLRGQRVDESKTIVILRVWRKVSPF